MNLLKKGLRFTPFWFVNPQSINYRYLLRLLWRIQSPNFNSLFMILSIKDIKHITVWKFWKFRFHDENWWSNFSENSKESLLEVLRQNIDGWCQQTFCFQNFLTTPSNVLPLHLKQTFLPIIWIFTEGEGVGIKSRLITF